MEHHQEADHAELAVAAEPAVLREQTRKGRVDRQTTTPFYLRMYCRMGGHHRYTLLCCASLLMVYIYSIDEFQNGAVPTEDELVVYTWYAHTKTILLFMLNEQEGRHAEGAL